MKAKKALKRIAKAESLLSGVLEQYPGAQDGLRELLGSAQSSLAQARVTLDLEETPVRKAPARAQKSGRSAPKKLKRTA